MSLSSDRVNGSEATSITRDTVPIPPHLRVKALGPDDDDVDDVDDGDDDDDDDDCDDDCGGNNGYGEES